MLCGTQLFAYALKNTTRSPYTQRTLFYGADIAMVTFNL